MARQGMNFGGGGVEPLNVHVTQAAAFIECMYNLQSPRDRFDGVGPWVEAPTRQAWPELYCYVNMNPVDSVSHPAHEAIDQLSHPYTHKCWAQ